MTPHDITLRERVDELEDENMRLDERVSELESVNADLYKALLVAMQSIDPANYTDLTVCNEALARVQEKGFPR